MLRYPEMVGHTLRHSGDIESKREDLSLTQLASAKHIDQTVNYRWVIRFKPFPHVIFRLSDWSMGRERSLSDYLKMVGIDPQNKVIVKNTWCKEGKWPQIALRYRKDDQGSIS
jgi:hypothetical protein